MNSEAPRWRAVVVLVAALGTVALTARLGFWQLSRAAEKEAMQSALDERSGLPALGAADLALQPALAAAQHHRKVSLRGRWLAEKTVYLDNRAMNGRAGFIVVTPLLLEGAARAVVVQRGWLARAAADRTLVPPYRTVEGEVEVAGSVAAPPSRLFEFAGAAGGPIRQNLDMADYAREVRVALLPLSVLQADSPAVTGDGLLRQWPAPAIDVHKHHGYAAQWFALAALVTGLYVWFQLIRPRLRHAH